VYTIAILNAVHEGGSRRGHSETVYNVDVAQLDLDRAFGNVGAMGDGDRTGLDLEQDELLVLFDMLHRWESVGHVSDPIDQAERVALWNLTAALETATNSAFSADYGEQLDLAKQRLDRRP
jgi:hypothetical protein